jgi:hypothetical protein
VTGSRHKPASAGLGRQRKQECSDRSRDRSGPGCPDEADPAFSNAARTTDPRE